MARFPKIDIRALVRMTERTGGLTRSNCCYCGNENVVAGDIWVCAYCESALRSSSTAAKLNDGYLTNVLARVNAFASSGKAESARSEYEKLLATCKEPQFMYRYALLCIADSNAEQQSVRYDRRGFMEENAQHREKSSTLFSTAKRMLTKAAKACQDQISAGEGDAFLVFTLFMINIKLHSMRAAKRLKDSIAEFNNPYLGAYAEMVYCAESGDAVLAAIASQAMLSGENFSPNALYYLAWALFRHGKPKDAAELLGAFSRFAGSDNIDSLSREISVSTSVQSL